MAVELFIQHNSTIQYPVVEEGAKLTLERKGTPGKLEFTVVKAPGLNFQEGDPVKLTVDGTPCSMVCFQEKTGQGMEPLMLWPMISCGI